MKVTTRAQRFVVVGAIAAGALGLGVGSAFAVSDLGPGSTGAGVKCVQQGLNFFGAGLSVDGDYGSLTTSAVESFQGSHGDSVDGDVGPQTGHSLITAVNTLIVQLHKDGQNATAESNWINSCSTQIPND
jgi:peptidoglycan hydrolase-like protein with peptidoglycan-binding domain